MRRLIAYIILVASGGLAAHAQSDSPYATVTDFANYSRRLRAQALLKDEPQVVVSTPSLPITKRFTWKTNIVTTVFWIGEQAGGNNPVPNNRSCWDLNWTANYGGYDNPESSARRNYIPVGFTPRQNPFYC